MDIASGVAQPSGTIGLGASLGLVSLTAASRRHAGRAPRRGRDVPAAVAGCAARRPPARSSARPSVARSGASIARRWCRRAERSTARPGTTWTPPTPGTTAPGAGAARRGARPARGKPAPLPALDTDGDGLPNTWETAYGLDPFDGGRRRRRGRRPDATAAPTRRSWPTAPIRAASLTRYFAEGATGAFFHTRFDLANPGGGRPAIVQLRFLTDAGDDRVAQTSSSPPARSVADRSVDDLPASANATFSTIVEADRHRRRRSDDDVGRVGGYGSHLETGVAAPSTTWYFAEGVDVGDVRAVLPAAEPAGDARSTATVRYLRPCGRRRSRRTYVLPPSSRTTIVVDARGAELASTDVSAAITATAPIVAERAMYLSQPGQPFAAGHESAGVTAAATDWFLAEGATGAFFDLFLLLANPGGTDATVEVEYLLTGGSSADEELRGAGQQPPDDLGRRRAAPGGLGPAAARRARRSRCVCARPMACRSSSSGRCGGRDRR